MKGYKVLKKQVFQNGNYSLVPIREEDRYDIMKWRNEQIYHLRQSKPLTKIDQDKYFDNVVAMLFDEKTPDQILFSFLERSKCIGYGGLVHINWENKNSELSFIMDTKLEKELYKDLWFYFLNLIEEVAFKELQLHKIFTFAFDLRPHLYPILIDSNYKEEARLKEHIYFEKKYIDIVIHSKLNSYD